MDERLLIKCDSSIYADNISSVLEANNITVRRHVDESTDRRTGTHDPDSVTALYVPDKDYEKALEIIAPIADRMHEAIPFCPKCGSDNAIPIAPSRYTTVVIAARHPVRHRQHHSRNIPAARHLHGHVHQIPECQLSVS